MKAGATAPCCDSATAASAVSRALGFTRLMTNSSGLPAASAAWTVTPTARRSSGVACTGITTRSATAIAAATMPLTAGGVSTSTSLQPRACSAARPAPRSGSARASIGEAVARASHHFASPPMSSVSMMPTGPWPRRSASTARWQVSVVLPAPPFRLARMMIRIGPSHEGTVSIRHGIGKSSYHGGMPPSCAAR